MTMILNLNLNRYGKLLFLIIISIALGILFSIYTLWRENEWNRYYNKIYQEYHDSNRQDYNILIHDAFAALKIANLFPTRSIYKAKALGYIALGYYYQQNYKTAEYYYFKTLQANNENLFGADPNIIEATFLKYWKFIS